MKILCPVDFSIASTDAVYYSAALLQKYDKREITILHCSFSGDIAELFDEFLEKQRRVTQDHMDTLMENMQKVAPDIHWSQEIIHGNPLDEITSYIKKHPHDMIVIGTKGLQNPKDRIFGSLTETLFEKSSAPILAVPQGYVFHQLKSIIFSIDEDSISSEKVVTPLLNLVKRYHSSLVLLHIKSTDERPLEYNLDLDYFLKGLNYQYHSKSSDDTLTKAINEVCRHESADLLCMIHRDRGWMLNLVHHSQVKEELDQLSMPILILHD